MGHSSDRSLGSDPLPALVVSCYSALYYPVCLANNSVSLVYAVCTTGCKNVRSFPKKPVEVYLGEQLDLFCDPRQSSATVRWSMEATSTSP